MFELCYVKAYHVNVDHCNVEMVCLNFTFNVCLLSENYTCSFQVVISRKELLGSRHRQKNDIKMAARKIWHEGINWFQLLNFYEHCVEPSIETGAVFIS